MVLLRRVIGDALRARRLSQHRTLREVSTAANVSLGYLSEIERGHKEASSELLQAICEALGARLSEVLHDAGDTLVLAEEMAEMLPPEPAKEGAGAASVPRGKAPAARATSPASREPAVAREGDVTVKVHHDGPLKTTLTAKRTVRAAPPPEQRRAEIFV
jgi:transcriptional regulator with XRE-family HTH domain